MESIEAEYGKIVIIGDKRYGIASSEEIEE